MSKKDKILHLVLTGEWFSKIESGEKREDYRDLSEYWRKYLTNDGDIVEFETVVFYLGYGEDRKSMTFECNGIRIDYPHPQWIDKGYNELKYCIKLGKRLL